MRVVEVVQRLGIGRRPILAVLGVLGHLSVGNKKSGQAEALFMQLSDNVAVRAGEQKEGHK